MRITDMIISDESGREKGFLDASAELDLEIGNENDFELTLSLTDYEKLGYKFYDRIYIPETEYGGVILYRKTSTLEDTVFLQGDTWRGLLAVKYIIPPDTKDALTVSGEANTIIAQIISGKFGDCFIASTSDSGINIKEYTFEPCVSVLDGLTRMLKTYGAKLDITYKSYDISGNVMLRAVKIVDYSEEIEYSNDNKVHFTTQEDHKGYNHLIVLGDEEAAIRPMVHLYADENGNIGQVQKMTGMKERTSVYEMTNETDKNKMMEEGKSKLEEMLDSTTLEITIQDIEVGVGDIVGGRERITGLYMKQPISEKILKLSNNEYSIEYKVGE